MSAARASKRAATAKRPLPDVHEAVKASWFVVQTKTGQEAAAREHLEQQQYEVYLPMASEEEAAGKVSRLRPLFPAYLFTRFDPFTKSMRPIASTRGVVRVVRFADRCAVVPDAVITVLKAQEGGDGFRVLKGKRYEVGQQVAIIDGPLAGRIATVVRDDVRVHYVVVSLDWVSRLSLARSSLTKAFGT